MKYSFLISYFVFHEFEAMAKVHVCNVLVLDNPSSFMSKLEFEITFECIEDLPEDLVKHFYYVAYIYRFLCMTEMKILLN